MLLLPVDCEKCNDSQKAGPYVCDDSTEMLMTFVLINIGIHIHIGLRCLTTHGQTMTNSNSKYNHNV